ncbi:MAG: helix-turn-helix transcriptional regulator [Clostridia bacterium]|nr:helix-turn-helix transcriptional regulator [Clostridia bacterium]
MTVIQDVDFLESTSVHHFFTPPSEQLEYLYYPVSAGFFDCKPHYLLQRNSYNSFLLLSLLSGSMTYENRSGSGVLRTGQTMLLDCHTPHRYAARTKCSFLFLHFDGGQSRAIHDDIIARSGNVLTVPSNDKLHEHLAILLNSAMNEPHLSDVENSSLIFSILMQLVKASGSTGSNATGNDMVDRAIEFIKKHYPEKLTVEMIAASTGYSTSYFTNTFSKETGMSPYHFLTRSRINAAQQLLQITQLSIQEIAFQTGFNSAANFCYTFRKEVGVSPSDFRRHPLSYT